MSIFSPVERQQAKLRLALTGVSGAGKTLSALYIAYGMTGNWGKIALIDTEHEKMCIRDRSNKFSGYFIRIEIYDMLPFFYVFF